MSKENVKKFIEELHRNVKLKERVGGLRLSHENLEELVSFAKEAGFDFTLEELKEENSKPAVEDLSIDELDQVVGGLKDKEGYTWTTLYYGCDKWQKNIIPEFTFDVIGKCGSCRFWDYDAKDPFKYLIFIGIKAFRCSLPPGG